MTLTSAPPQSLSIREACRRLHLTESQLWTAIRMGQGRGITSCVVNAGSFVLHYRESLATACRVVVTPDILEVHYEEPVERLRGHLERTVLANVWYATLADLVRAFRRGVRCLSGRRKQLGFMFTHDDLPEATPSQSLKLAA